MQFTPGIILTIVYVIVSVVSYKIGTYTGTGTFDLAFKLTPEYRGLLPLIVLTWIIPFVWGGNVTTEYQHFFVGLIILKLCLSLLTIGNTVTDVDTDSDADAYKLSYLFFGHPYEFSLVFGPAVLFSIITYSAGYKTFSLWYSGIVAALLIVTRQATSVNLITVSALVFSLYTLDPKLPFDFASLATSSSVATVTSLK